MNRRIRILLIVAMLASSGLILWFPMHTIPNVVGYVLIAIGMGIVWWSTGKNKQKK